MLETSKIILIIALPYGQTPLSSDIINTMKRLFTKKTDFQPGRKVFVKPDTSYDILENNSLPEEYLFGIEIPEDSGDYYVETSIGAFLLKVSIDEIELLVWRSTSGTGNDYVFNSNYDSRLTQKAGLLPVILPIDVYQLDALGYRDSPLTSMSSYWEAPTHATHFEAGDLFVFFNGAFAVNKNTYEVEWIFSEENTWGGSTYNAFPALDRSYGAANSSGNEEYYVGISSYGVEGLYVLKTQTGAPIHRETTLYSQPYLNEGVHVFPSGRNNKFFLWDGGGWSGESTPQVYILEIDELDSVSIYLHPENESMSVGGRYLMEPRLFMASKSFFVDANTGEYYYSSGYTLTKFNADDSVAWHIEYDDASLVGSGWNADGWTAFCIKRKGKIIIFSRWTVPLIVDDQTGTWELADIDESALVTVEHGGFAEYPLTDFWNNYELEIPRVVADDLDYLPVLDEFTNSGNFVELLSINLDTFDVKSVDILPGEGDGVFYNQSGWPLINSYTGVAYIRIFNGNSGGDNLYRLIGWSNEGVVTNIVLSYWDHVGTNGFYIEDLAPSLMLSESGDLLVHMENCIAKYGDEVWTLNVGQTAQLTSGEWYTTKNTDWNPGTSLFGVFLTTNSCSTNVYGEINTRYFPYSMRTFTDTTNGSGIFTIDRLPGFSATSSLDITNLFPTEVPNEFISTPRTSATTTSATIRTFNLETGDVTDLALPNITTGLVNTSRYIRESVVKRPNGNILFLYHKVYNFDAPELRMFEYDGVSWTAKASTIYPASENNPNVPIGNSGYRRHLSVYHNDKVYSILFKRVSDDDFNVREYDFVTNSWSEYDSIPVPEVPINRLSISASYLDGRVYFTNGYVYDIEDKSLYMLPNFPFPDFSSARYVTFRNNCVFFLDSDLTIHVYPLENINAPY